MHKKPRLTAETRYGCRPSARPQSQRSLSGLFLRAVKRRIIQSWAVFAEGDKKRYTCEVRAGWIRALTADWRGDAAEERSPAAGQRPRRNVMSTSRLFSELRWS
ncbi:hypothetical protein GN956_G6002 [Arapaima gigas]